MSPAQEHKIAIARLHTEIELLRNRLDGVAASQHKIAHLFDEKDDDEVPEDLLFHLGRIEGLVTR